MLPAMGVPRGELPDGPLAHLQLLAARLVDLPEPRLLRSSFTQDCLMKRPDGQGHPQGKQLGACIT